MFEVNDALKIWLRFILVLALGSAQLSTEKNHWTGLQREGRKEIDREKERETEGISQLGNTTKSYRGIILVRPEMRERKSVPVSADGNKCFFVHR